MTTIYVDSRKRVAGSDSDFEVDLGESLHLQSDARKIRIADSFLSTDRGRYLYWVDAAPLSLEGVSQMDSILPERLPALVRPAFDLVLRRIRSLKRCVQACGCKIMTPRYACNLAPGCISSEPTFAGLRKNQKN